MSRSWYGQIAAFAFKQIHFFSVEILTTVYVQWTFEWDWKKESTCQSLNKIELADVLSAHEKLPLRPPMANNCL